MLNTVCEKIYDLDYKINKIDSLAVFIPVVSLVVYKIKMANIVQTLKNEAALMPRQQVLTGKTFDLLIDVPTWHWLGSVVQTLSFIALSIFAHQAFVIPMGLSIYEFICVSKRENLDKLIGPKI